VAVLTAVFAANGSYTSGPAYVNGLAPAVYLGAVVVLSGSLIALTLPERDRAPTPLHDPSASRSSLAE